MKLNWTKTDDYLCAQTKNFKFMPKMAIFDLDSTLVVPRIGSKGNGKGFPLDENDWMWQFDTVKPTLLKLSEFNYCIVIISNQGGMAKGKQTFEVWTKKLDQICNDLNLDMHVFCAVAYNKYRKPLPTWLYQIVPSDAENNLDRQLSFFCGDACGRKNDFSDTDYKFAVNCMLNFKTPENMFLGSRNEILPINYPVVEPKELSLNFIPHEKEMIIMTGLPGSGKSHISKELCTKYGYVVINQDTLKTKEKCISTALSAMRLNKSVVIDSTNPGITERGVWITLAQDNDYLVRSIELTTSKELSIHNNHYRNLVDNKPIVPTIAYNMYKSKYSKPKINEGFAELIKATPGTPKDYRYFYYLC